MKTRTKRLLSVMCVLAMLCSIVPMPVALAEGEVTPSYTASFGADTDTSGSVPSGTIYTITKSGGAPKFASYKGENKVTVTINGTPTDFYWALKMETGTKIDFKAPGVGTLTLYCNSGALNNTITSTPTVNGVAGTAATEKVVQDGTNYTVSFKTEANTDYSVMKGSGSTNVVYIVWAPDDPRDILNAALAAAKATVAEWEKKVSVDGSDVPVTEKWVTQDDLKAYNTLIKAIEDYLNSGSVTEENIIKAKGYLDTYARNFAAAQKPGTKPGALTYTLTDTQKDFTIMGDRDLLPPGQPVFLSPYFTAVVDDDGSNEGLHYRLQNGKTNCALEVGRASSKNGVEFTTEKVSTVKITFRSTDAENISVLALMKDGALVDYTSVNSTAGAYVTSAIAQAGDGKTSKGTGNQNVVVVYENLPAGTYRVCTPEVTVAEGTAKNADPSVRGARVMEVEVTEDGRAPLAPLTAVTDPSEIEKVEVLLPQGFEDNTFVLWLPDDTSARHSVTTVFTGKDGKVVANRNTNVQWTVDNADVATVEPVKAVHDPNGKSPGTIAPVKAGETHITIAVVDASGNPITGADGQPLKATYKVVVKQRVTSVTVTGPNSGTTGEDLQREVRGKDIQVEMKYQVKSTPETAEPTDKTVTWSIQREDGKAIEGGAVTIDKDTGVVTATPAAEKGVYVVTATSNDGGNKSGSAKLTLVKAEITGVKLATQNDDDTLTEYGDAITRSITMVEELTLVSDTSWATGTYNVAPWDGADALEWTVEPADAVELEAAADSTLKYTVKPLKAEEVTITATSVRDNTKKATLALTVSKATPKLTIGTRNDQVRAEGNTVNLNVAITPATLLGDVKVTIAPKSGPTGSAAVAANTDATWNYQATLPQNTSSTERAVYTVTAEFDGNDSWEAVTTTHELQVLKVGEANIRFVKVNGGNTLVTKTSGDSGDDGLSLDVEAVYVKAGTQHTDKLEYQWYKLSAIDEEPGEGNKIAGATAATYKKDGAVKSTDAGLYRCEVSYNDTDPGMGLVSAVSPIITVKVNKAANPVKPEADIETGAKPWPTLLRVKAGWQYSLDQGLDWKTIGAVQGADADGLGSFALEKEDPVARDGHLKAVNDLLIRIPTDAETLASEAQKIDLLRATTPGLVVRDQEIVVNNYGNYSVNGTDPARAEEVNPLKGLYEISVDGGTTWTGLTEANAKEETNDQGRKIRVITSLPKGLKLPVGYTMPDGTKLTAETTLSDDATKLTNSVAYQVRIKSGGHVLGSYEAKTATPSASWTALQNAVAAAGETGSDVKVQVSESNDGTDVRPKSDVEPPQYWVKRTDRNAFDAAYTTASGLEKACPWYTTAQVTAAAKAMTDADAAYRAAWNSTWPHIHEWDTEWSSNAVGHWHKCIAPATGSYGACGITDYSKTTEAGAAYAAHGWGAGTVTKEPTCTDTGVRDFECPTCKRTKTEVEPVKGHDWGAWTFSDSHSGYVDRVCGRDSKHTESKDLTATLDVSSFTYNGTARTPAVTVTVGEDAEAQKLTLDTDYTVSYEDNTDAGTATAVITGKGGYAGTLSLTFTITPKPLTAKDATVENRAYDGTTAVTVTAVTLDGVESGDDVKVDLTKLTAALKTANVEGAGVGTYTEVTISDLVLDGADKGNYSIQGNVQLKLTTPAEIGKADLPTGLTGRTGSINIYNSLEQTYEYGLSNLRPDLPAGMGWGATTYEVKSVSFTYGDYYDPSKAEVSIDSGNMIHIPIQFNDVNIEGRVGIITVTVHSANYKDFDAYLNINATNKTHVTFAWADGIKVEDKTYDGQPYTQYTKDDVKVLNGSTYVTGADVEITYVGRGDTNYNSATPPTNAGTYRVVVRIADDDANYIGRQAYDFNIFKADGDVSVTMADYKCGEQNTVSPQPDSPTNTNPTTGVRYAYKVKDADDSAYTADKPAAALGSTLAAPVEETVYTVRATFPESENYKAATATADFTVSHVHVETYTQGETTHYRLCSCGDQGHEGAHDFQLQGKKDPSCTEAGSTGVELCGECKLVKTPAQSIAALGHAWDEGKVTTPATTEAAGVMTYTCTRCGETKTGIIPPIDPDVDKSKLKDAIDEANEEKEKPKVSPDGEDVDPGDKWVPPEVKDKYEEEIKKAEDVLKDPDATQEEVDKATEDMKKATEEFKKAQQDGKKPGSSDDDDDDDDDYDDEPDEPDNNGKGKDIYFTDVPEDHWAKKDIYKVAEMGLMTGVAEHRFDMYSSITRGSLATIIYRHANGEAGVSNSFTDVPAGRWYYDGVGWCAREGVVLGYPDKSFKPNQDIARQELAAMLYRYAKYLGMDTNVGNAISVFTDNAETGAWAVESVNWCVSKGILKGRGGNILDPTSTATRAECALMLSRFVDLL